MNKRIKKAWRAYLATNSVSDFCRWFYYNNQQAFRTGAIEELAVILMS